MEERRRPILSGMANADLSNQARHVLCILSRSTAYGPQSLIALAAYSALSAKQVEISLRRLESNTLAEPQQGDLWQATEQGTTLAIQILG